MRTTRALGLLFGSTMLLVLLTGASSTPLQCDDPEGNPEDTYGKLQSIPPADTDSLVLADEPVPLTPTKTQHDILKSRNSKFLGVDRSSEEA